MKHIDRRQIQTIFHYRQKKPSQRTGPVWQPVDRKSTRLNSSHFLHLTDVGREVAEKIYKRHCFFTEQLIAAGVDPKTAEADACRIEHIISDESFDRLKEAAEQEQN